MDRRVDEQVIGFLQRSSKYGAKKEAVVKVTKVEKGQRSYFVIEPIEQRSSRYGSKKEAVVKIRKVEKGRRSYFVVESKDGHIFKVPSKYMKRKKNKIINAIKLPVPDTSKPSINKPDKPNKFKKD